MWVGLIAYKMTASWSSVKSAFIVLTGSLLMVSTEYLMDEHGVLGMGEHGVIDG